MPPSPPALLTALWDATPAPGAPGAAVLAATPARASLALTTSLPAGWAALGGDAGAADGGGRTTLVATSAAALDAGADGDGAARALAAAVRGAVDGSAPDAARLLPLAAGSRPGGRVVAVCVGPRIAFDAVPVRGAPWRRGDGGSPRGRWGWLTVDAARRLAVMDGGGLETTDDTPPAIAVGVWVRPRGPWRGAGWAAAVRFCAAAAAPGVRRVAQGGAFLLAVANENDGWRLLSVSRRDGAPPGAPLPLASWRGAAGGRATTAASAITLTLTPGPAAGRLAGGDVADGGAWRREWSVVKEGRSVVEEPPQPPPPPAVDEVCDAPIVAAVDDGDDDIDDAALEAKYGLTG